MRTYSILVLEGKERAFIEKVNSRCFCWFPAALLVHQNSTPIWRLHTKLYKGAWNTWANNSEIVGHNCKDLRLGQIVYILVFYNISFSWLLLLDSFQYNFLLRDGENDLFCSLYFRIQHRQARSQGPLPSWDDWSLQNWQSTRWTVLYSSNRICHPSKWTFSVLNAMF